MTDQLVIEIPETGRKVMMPLQLDACDKRQFVEMCRLIRRLECDEIDFQEFQILAVYALLDMKRSKKSESDDQIDLAMTNIYRLGEFVRGFLDIGPEKTKFKLTYSGNKIPFVRPMLKKYHGPKDYFIDVDFGEYEAGLNLFFEYQASNEMELLYKMLAVFFCQKKGGKRQKLTKDNMEERLKAMRKVDPAVAYAFYYNFGAFHMYFTSSEVMWEGKRIDLSIIFTEQPEDESEDYESPYPGLGMKSIGHQLAESGVFGNLTEVRETNLWEAVLRLYDMRKRDLDFSAKNKLKKPAANGQKR